MKSLTSILGALALVCLGSGFVAAQDNTDQSRHTGQGDNTGPTSAPQELSQGVTGEGKDQKGKAEFHRNWDFHVWADADMLLWWTRAQRLPPLATRGSVNDPAPGVLGQPGTTLALGDQKVESEERLGGRFTAGMWLTEIFGFEGGYFFLGERGQRFGATADGGLLARPFVAVVDPNPSVDSSGNAIPPTLIGQSLFINSISANTFNRFQGANLDVDWTLTYGDNYHLTLLTGFRFLKLEDGLDIASQTITGVTLLENFHTRNEFYGGDIGLRADMEYRRFRFSVLTKLGIGGVQEQVRVAGSSSPAQQQPGALLAGLSNMSGDGRDAFAFVPEVDLNIGYQVSKHWRVYGGYSFLYLTDCLRAGQQVDLGVNPAFLPFFSTSTPVNVRPGFPMNSSDFWAQGLNFGVEVRY